MAGVSAGVSITGITNAGSVVTVAASGHGLSAGQGFSIQNVSPAGLNVNGTVVAANAAGFTFNMANPPAYVSGGKVLPAKEVIILSIANQPGGINVRYLLWLTTAQPIPNSSIVSQWPNASLQEAGALVAGTTMEMGRNQFFPSTLSEAQIEAFLAADFSTQQSALAAALQPGQFFGVYFDGVGWSG